MESAASIRNAVAQVAQLRENAVTDPPLGAAVTWVKRFQSRRFASTYADLIAGDQYRAATRFFLDELYSDASYAERDAQFSRIAGAIQRLLPAPAVATAVGLAQLHASSEQLDHAMGLVLLADPGAMDLDEAACYTRAWRAVGRRSEREMQLREVLKIGADLDRLTRMPGLRLMLKMMRGPAYAAGLNALQRFLELGFDTFAGMGMQAPGAHGFLAIVRERESKLIDRLFDADHADCRAEIIWPVASNAHSQSHKTRMNSEARVEAAFHGDATGFFSSCTH